MTYSLHTAPAGTPASAARPLLRRLALLPLRAALVLVFLTFALVAVGTAGGRMLPYHVFPVLSGSMTPTISTGSIAIVRPARAEDLRVGDVLTFHPPGKGDIFVTHRIAARKLDAGSPYFVTKGDANGATDAWAIPAQGGGWKLWFSIPLAGYLFGFVQAPLGRFGLMVVAVALLSGWALVRVWRSAPEPHTE